MKYITPTELMTEPKYRTMSDAHLALIMYERVTIADIGTMQGHDDEANQYRDKIANLRKYWKSHPICPAQTCVDSRNLEFSMNDKEHNAYKAFCFLHKDKRSPIKVEFTPTGIGSVIRVRCGQFSKDITDYDCW